MTILLRALLGVGGAIYLLGAVWFFGEKGSYLGLLGGTAMLAWSLLWSANGNRQAICLAFLILAATATGWIAVGQLMRDADATMMSVSTALFVFSFAAIWVRQRIGIYR